MSKGSSFCDKIPDRSILKGDRVVWAHSLKGHSPSQGGRQGGKECKVTIILSPQSGIKKGAMNSTCPLLFTESGFSRLWDGLAHIQCDTFSLQFLCKHLEGHTQWYVLDDYKVSHFNNEMAHALCTHELL